MEPNNGIVTTTAAVAKRKAEDNLAAGYDVAAAAASAPPVAKKLRSNEDEFAKRRARLDSNRKAARESRRRKKVLVEELQRSVIFFTRANAQLKQKNEGLEAMLFAARSQTQGNNGGGNGNGVAGGQHQQQAVQAVPTPAMTGVLQKGVAAVTSRNDGDAAGDKKPSAHVQATTSPPIVSQPASAHPTHATLPLPAASAQQAMVQQNNNNLMANWIAMAQSVPNPMAAMQIPPGAMAMGMFNPAAAAMAANPAAAQAGLMGMAAAAGMGNPFMGQFQQSSSAMANNVLGTHRANNFGVAAPAPVAVGGNNVGSRNAPANPGSSENVLV